MFTRILQYRLFKKLMKQCLKMGRFGKSSGIYSIKQRHRVVSNHVNPVQSVEGAATMAIYAVKMKIMYMYQLKTTVAFCVIPVR